MNKLASLACMTLVAAVHGQNSFVVPSANRNKPGNHFDYETFQDPRLLQHPVRIQLVYNTADIVVPATLIRGINFRRSNWIGGPNPAGTATLSIDLSVGPNDAATALPTFASNHGTFVGRVFSGNVNLPADAYRGINPAQFVLRIPFTAGFPYVQSWGKALVADIRVTTHAPSVNAPWWLDSDGIEHGTREENGYPPATCRFTNGLFNNTGGSSGGVYPGSHWQAGYGSIIPNLFGIGAIGNLGAGQSWGGLRLPISLASLGAPGCFWNTNILFTAGLRADSLGWAWWPSIPIPNDPALVGAVFYDQALFLDPGANAAGIVVSMSTRWVIGSGALPEAAQVVRLVDTLPYPTGTLRRQALIAEFVHL
jgi:hypothetical protein